MSFLKSSDTRRGREKQEKEKKRVATSPPLFEQPCSLAAKPEHKVVGTAVEVTSEIFLFADSAPAQKGSRASKESGHAKDNMGSESSGGLQIENYEKVDKECNISFIQHVGPSVIIEIGFEDESTLHVEMNRESIQNICLSNPTRGWSHGSNPKPSLAIISDHLTRFIMDCRLAEVSSSSNDSKRELTFISTDGVKLVMELSPGAIKKIDYK